LGLALALTLCAAQATSLLRGQECTSRVVYAADSTTALELRFAYSENTHVRLWLGSSQPNTPARLMRFWQDGKAFGTELTSGRSLELEAPARRELRAQLELRRALLDFERFEWRGEGSERRVELTLSGEKTALGTLLAREWNAGSQRPSSILFSTADGQVLDSFRNIVWKDKQVESCEFWHAQTRIWVENEFRREPRTFTPDFFAPADRRGDSVPRNASPVVTMQVPEHAVRRVELKANCTLEEARAELERLRAEAAQQGLALENKATLELDDALAPKAVLLRLEKLPEQLPEGYERRPAASALAVQIAGFEALKPQALAPLQERLPKGAPVRPYLRWLLVPGGEKQLLLVVPAPKS
jgi:hypothetical protein